MLRFSNVRSSFNFAIERVKANPLFYFLWCWLAIALIAVAIYIVGVLIIIPGVVLASFLHAPWIVIVSEILFIILELIAGGCIYAGMFMAFKKEIDGGNASFLDIINGYKLCLPACTIFLSINVALLVPLLIIFYFTNIVLYIIAALILGLLAYPIAIGSYCSLVEGERGLLGLKSIFKACRHFSISFAMYCFIITIAAEIVGLLCCCVGLLFTIPIGMLIIFHLYRQLVEAKAGNSEIDKQKEDAAS